MKGKFLFYTLIVEVRGNGCTHIKPASFSRIIAVLTRFRPELISQMKQRQTNSQTHMTIDGIPTPNFIYLDFILRHIRIPSLLYCHVRIPGPGARV